MTVTKCPNWRNLNGYNIRAVGDGTDSSPMGLGHGPSIPVPASPRQQMATSHNLLAIPHLLGKGRAFVTSITHDESKQPDTAL